MARLTDQLGYVAHVPPSTTRTVLFSIVLALMIGYVVACLVRYAIKRRRRRTIVYPASIRPRGPQRDGGADGPAGPGPRD